VYAELFEAPPYDLSSISDFSRNIDSLSKTISLLVNVLLFFGS